MQGFIHGIHRVLQPKGHYHMTCFSYKNGSAPNHFTKDDIKGYFSNLFHILTIDEEVVNEKNSQSKRYFYISLMEKK